jgi:hypothetical protein
MEDLASFSKEGHGSEWTVLQMVIRNTRTFHAIYQKAMLGEEKLMKMQDFLKAEHFIRKLSKSESPVRTVNVPAKLNCALISLVSCIHSVN